MTRTTPTDSSLIITHLKPTEPITALTLYQVGKVLSNCFVSEDEQNVELFKNQISDTLDKLLMDLNDCCDVISLQSLFQHFNQAFLTVLRGESFSSLQKSEAILSICSIYLSSQYACSTGFDPDVVEAMAEVYANDCKSEERYLILPAVSNLLLHGLFLGNKSHNNHDDDEYVDELVGNVLEVLQKLLYFERNSSPESDTSVSCLGDILDYYSSLKEGGKHNPLIPSMSLLVAVEQIFQDITHREYIEQLFD